MKKIGPKQFKSILKNQIKLFNEKSLKDDMKDMKKLDECKKDVYGLKNYFKELKTDEILIKFRIRTNMLDTKFNYKNKKDYSNELWVCDSCASAIETQSHLLWCPSYQHLRQGKKIDDDHDLVIYMRDVLQIRQELKLRR